MKIIVTGALGHIGSYLIRYLPLQFPEAEIVMIDNMMTHRYTSLFNLPVLGHYTFIESDITKIDLLPILKDAQILIHLAAITDATGTFDKAEELEANNYQATVKVAEACAKSGTRLIALSSTSVYSTQGEVVAEDCKPGDLKPVSPYAITKLKEEQIVTKFCVESGLKAISCRFGTIFGASPGMRFHTAVNKFCWQAAMGLPISVWSTAYDQKRPYLDIFDAVRAISFIIRNDIFDGKIYNILTLNVTVGQVLEIVREFIPNLQLGFVDNKIMNQLSYEVSCDRFIAEGFTFSGDLRRGVGETIELLRQANISNR
jgi:UDP-glucose 4-epimerase